MSAWNVVLTSSLGLSPVVIFGGGLRVKAQITINSDVYFGLFG